MPAVRQNIPIVIRNSRHPDIEGTRIGPDAVRKPGTVKAITCRTGMTVVHLFVPGSGMLPGISDGLNDLFERNQVKVEMVQAQQDGVSFAVESSPRLPELLRGVDESVRIVVDEDSAIVSLAGRRDYGAGFDCKARAFRAPEGQRHPDGFARRFAEELEFRRT